MCESNREAEQVAVLPEDRARLLSVWPEAAPLVLAAAPDGVELLENPAGIAAEELHFRLRALICFGADLAPLRAGFAAQFGADLPLIDLRGSAAEGTALRAGIFAGLWRLSAEETVVTARAHADALRQIAALRQENERLRSGFAALERAALQRDQGLRERVYWNQPQPGKSLPLRDGVPVVQRLACGAAGLSDVGFWLTDVQAQSGHLEVWLTTLQDGARPNTPICATGTAPATNRAKMRWPPPLGARRRGQPAARRCRPIVWRGWRRRIGSWLTGGGCWMRLTLTAACRT